ncbi:MAG: putative Ig domain-containing protein [Acidimicrobiia bacterium]|nr:putative Ig domain-containing protein [Acidimicrobiia bacterium]
MAGVWEDTSAPAPAAATGRQLAQEAVAAADHFGNTSAGANRDAQYVVVSPTGTNPDDYQSGGFCAWHDYTADDSLDGGGAVATPWGAPIAFTNLPYVPDAGAGCGAGLVNYPGTLDGVTLVESHSYAETITDQFPAGGWLDSRGEENADKCQWLASGPGAAQDITLATGRFPVQSTWANDFNGGAGGCEVSHPIETTDVVTVSDPGDQASAFGTGVALQVHGTDSNGGQLTFSAAGLPPGLSISSSGLISGTPTSVGVFAVTVTASDAAGASGGASFTWTVTKAPTTLTATSVLRGGLTATLTRSDTHAGIGGQTIVFTVRGSTQCTSTTDSRGVARCPQGFAAALRAGGYQADYTGSADYLPSSADARAF